MIPPLEMKVVLSVTDAAAVVNAAVTTTSFDTFGYDYAVVHTILHTVDAALTVLKLQEADDNSTWVDVAASIYGTANNDTGSASTLPTSSAGSQVVSWFVNLHGARKRYIKPAVTVGAGTTGCYVTILAELWRAHESPRTAVAAGYGQRIIL